MGILDDAIREHLELIRSHGATDSEVQRLEDEAFGPPTRPDEEDFPGAEMAREESGNGVATESAVEELGPDDAVAHEDVTTMLPAAPRDEPVEAGEEPVGAGEAGDAMAEEPAEPDSESLAAESEADEEPVAEVHPVLEEPAEELQEERSDEATGPPQEEGPSLYDQTRDELGGDRDLRLDEEQPVEPRQEEPQSAEPPFEEHDVAESEGAMPLEPIESLDTVEHPFPDEIVESDESGEEPPPSDEHAVHEEPASEEEGEGGEDMLADTPEFLKDAPEDDELWFEQGEPKDFDF